MSTYGSFSGELRKIAGAKAVVVGGLAGGAVGGRTGARARRVEQRKDDERHRRGFITKREWERRKKVRMAEAASNIATGSLLGGSIPIAAKSIRNWGVESIDAGARAAGRTTREVSEEIKKSYNESLQQQVDYAVRQIRQAGKEMGESMGEGFAESLNNVSVNQGKPPVVRMEHELSPALTRLASMFGKK